MPGMGEEQTEKRDCESWNFNPKIPNLSNKKKMAGF